MMMYLWHGLAVVDACIATCLIYEVLPESKLYSIWHKLE